MQNKEHMINRRIQMKLLSFVCCVFVNNIFAQDSIPNVKNAKEIICEKYGIDISKLENPGQVNSWLSQCGFPARSDFYEIPIDNDSCVVDFYYRGEKVSLDKCIFLAIPSETNDTVLLLSTNSDWIFFPKDIKGVFAVYLRYNGHYFYMGNNDFHEWRKLYWIYFIYDHKPFFRDFHKYDLTSDFIPRANVLTFIPYSEMEEDSSIEACIVTDYIYNYYKNEFKSFGISFKTGIANVSKYFSEIENRIIGHDKSQIRK